MAIARALACDPQLLLLDEPLGALDLQLRRQMQGELKALQKKLGITFIYITHDQEEALNMSDLIAVMNGGQFEQIGAPEEIYEHPTTRFAAQFIGQSNIIEGVVASAGQDSALVEVCPGKRHGRPPARSRRASASPCPCARSASTTRTRRSTALRSRASSRCTATSAACCARP